MKISIKGWYSLVWPIVDGSGNAVDNLNPYELVSAESINADGEVWVVGLDSHERAWVAASSLTRAEGAPGEWE